MGLQVACTHHGVDSNKKKRKGKQTLNMKIASNAKKAGIRIILFVPFLPFPECYKFMLYTLTFGPKTIDYLANTYNGWPYKGMLFHSCADTECRNHASILLPWDTPSPSKLPLMKNHHHRLNVTYRVHDLKFKDALSCFEVISRQPKP